LESDCVKPLLLVQHESGLLLINPLRIVQSNLHTAIICGTHVGARRKRAGVCGNHPLLTIWTRKKKLNALNRRAIAFRDVQNRTSTPSHVFSRHDKVNRRR